MSNTLKEAEALLASISPGDWSLAEGDTILRTPDGRMRLTNLGLSDEEFRAHAALIASAPKVIRMLVEQVRDLSQIHRWTKHIGDWECCAVCGVVRRYDDLNKPCRGPVRATVRGEF